MNKSNFYLFVLLCIAIAGAGFFAYKRGYLRFSDKSTALVKSKGKIVATVSDFSSIMSILEKSDSGLQFIPLLKKEEQVKVYMKLVEDYIVTNYLIGKYLKENGIKKDSEVRKEFKQYMKIMKNNFYSSVFQKKLNEKIAIDDAAAEKYYNSEKDKIQEFLTAPFIKKVPGIEARAAKIEDKKSLKDYESSLKNNKNVIHLERVNPVVRGTSISLVNALKDMKDGEIKEVAIENGAKFAVYRIKDHKGEWNSYKDVSDKAKEVLRLKVLERDFVETIRDLRSNSSIEIDQSAIESYMNEKKPAFTKPNVADQVVANDEKEVIEEAVVDSSGDEIEPEVK